MPKVGSIFAGSKDKQSEHQFQSPAPGSQLHHPPITESSSRLLLCLIEGDDSIFLVKADVKEIVVHLKEHILEKGRNMILSHVDAKDLVLFKVTRLVTVWLRKTQMWRAIVPTP
jgi:Crinkler effector protein N-terminal domain